MLKLVPKYQKGKVLPTPQQLQQAIDKKYPDYAWVRDHDLKKPLSNIDPVGATYVKAVAAGVPAAATTAQPLTARPEALGTAAWETVTCPQPPAPLPPQRGGPTPAHAAAPAANCGAGQPVPSCRLH